MFGKHKSERLDKLPRDYLEWIVNGAADFSEEVRAIAKDALAGVYPTRTTSPSGESAPETPVPETRVHVDAARA